MGTLAYKQRRQETLDSVAGGMIMKVKALDVDFFFFFLAECTEEVVRELDRLKHRCVTLFKQS